MAILSRLFNRGNRLTHADASIRLEALQALDAAGLASNQETLLELANNDPAADVRSAAIAVVSDSEALGRLLDSENSQVADAAAQRITSLLAEGVGTPTATHPRVIACRMRCINSDNASDTLPALLNDLSKPTEAAQLALKVRGEARDQVLAHSLLAGESGLAALVKAAKGHDKSLHRYAREHADRIKTARRQCDEDMVRLAEIDESIVRQLASMESGPSNNSTRAKLEKLSRMRSEQSGVCETARECFAETGGDGDVFIVPPSPLDGIALPEAPERDLFIELVPQLKQLADDMRQGAGLEQITQRRESLTDAWLNFADQQPPDDTQHQVFESTSRQFNAFTSAWQRAQRCDVETMRAPTPVDGNINTRQISKQIDQRNRWLRKWKKPVGDIRWPEHHAIPAQVELAQQTLESIHSDIDGLNAQLQQAKGELQVLVDAANQCVENGQVKQAIAKLRKARVLQQAGVHDLDAEITSLSAQVDQLRDWQSFATNPKRQELLDAVTALADTPLEPADQADRLRALRDQWQQLGGATNAAQAQQLKDFDAQAERAFEPCKAFYAQQAEEREHNLQQRIGICDQLERYLQDTQWNSADMQAAQSILHTARDSWRDYHPCDRKALKPIQNRFEKLQDQLHAILKRTWDANAEYKQQLIEQAKALMSEDLDTQTNGAKALQQQWREVGSVPRGIDQKLWREFRKVCDEIFSNRDQAHQNAQAAEQVQLIAVATATTALENEIETLSNTASEPNKASPARLRDLLRDIETARDGMRTPSTLHRRATSAQQTYEKLLASQAKSAAANELITLLTWDAQVTEAELANAAIDTPHAIFNARANNKAEPANWQRLVIEAEIAAELSGPSDEQALRMQIQVDLMNTGTRLQDFSAMDRCKAWCAAGPKDAQANQLRERMKSALSALAAL